jgi:hypothetical protein
MRQRPRVVFPGGRKRKTISSRFASNFFVDSSVRQELLGIEKAQIVGHNIGSRFTDAYAKGHLSCTKTVPVRNVFKRRGLPSSEKQIPQVVENIEKVM